MSDDNQVWNYVTRRDKDIQCCFCGIIFNVRGTRIWHHLTNEHNVIREPTYIKLNKSGINRKDKVKEKSQVGSSGRKKQEKRSLVWEYFTTCQNEPHRALCNICKISISTKSYSSSSSTSNMLGHLKSKHALLGGEKKRQKCSYCGKKFYFPKKITNFGKKDCEEMHASKERYPCIYDSCSKKFQVASALRRHISAVHKKEKANICDKCGRAFNQQTQLKTHSRIHTGENPFECAKCLKKFRFASTRHNHKCVSS